MEQSPKLCLYLSSDGHMTNCNSNDCIILSRDGHMTKYIWIFELKEGISVSFQFLEELQKSLHLFYNLCRPAILPAKLVHNIEKFHLQLVFEIHLTWCGRVLGVKTVVNLYWTLEPAHKHNNQEFGKRF